MGLRVLCGIAENGTSEAARVSAVALILERGWGKAPQAHTGSDGEGGIKVIIRHIVEGRDAPRPIDNSNPHTIEHAPARDDESEP